MQPHREFINLIENVPQTVEYHLAALPDKVVGGDMRRASSLLKQGGARCEN
jgi:hypothetical protein